MRLPEDSSLPVERVRNIYGLSVMRSSMRCYCMRFRLNYGGAVGIMGTKRQQKRDKCVGGLNACSEFRAVKLKARDVPNSAQVGSRVRTSFFAIRTIIHFLDAYNRSIEKRSRRV